MDGSVQKVGGGASSARELHAGRRQTRLVSRGGRRILPTDVKLPTDLIASPGAVVPELRATSAETAIWELPGQPGETRAALLAAPGAAEFKALLARGAKR
jgi:hypothetical protein